MPDFTAAFDSSTAMIISLSQFLEGKGFPGTGSMPANEILGKLLDWLPNSLKRNLYAESGRFDGLDAAEIGTVDIADMEKWVCSIYKDQKYPAIAIGSTNGALNHLYAALGIPWLPQTFLIPVKKPPYLDKDKPKEVISWAQEAADLLLKNIPGLGLHHMMDPNHDRLHLNTITYFRVKKLGLGEHYQKFISDKLQEGGKILIINCEQKWPVSRISERNVFQFGGAGGGIKAEEYYQGSERVSRFLKEYESNVDHWDAPDMDEEAPEAEWGYQDAINKDILSLSREKQIEVEQLRFVHPEDPSAYVADLYRDWYRQMGREDDRLLIECFALHDPYWAIKSCSVPLWMLFNDGQSADFVENYLKNRPEFDEIYMMLMSHGTESIGLAGIERWDKILTYARKNQKYIGVSRDDYPVNFGVYMRYFEDMQDKISERYPLPESMQLSYAREFLTSQPDRYKMHWEDLS
ncbi:MAG: hypothetical protein ACLFT3_03255 [Cyclobacteriaceae bacterium]